jgi:hypothetical protein
MTREEGLQFIGQSIKNHVDMARVADAIEALSEEPCEDAISRQAVLDTMSELNTISFYEAQEDSNECYHELRKAMEQLPSVTPMQKTGQWIENAPECQNIDPPYICSECGNMHLRKTNYCDQCGAKMVDPQESEGAE